MIDEASGRGKGARVGKGWQYGRREINNVEEENLNENEGYDNKVHTITVEKRNV